MDYNQIEGASMKRILHYLSALLLIPVLALSVSAAGTAVAASQALVDMQGALKVLFAIFAVLAVLCVITLAIKRRAGISTGSIVTLFIATIAVACICVFCMQIYQNAAQQDIPSAPQPEGTVQTPGEQPDVTEAPETEAPTETTAPTEAPVIFAPAMTADSDPSNWEINWQIIENDVEVESFTRAEPISFGDPEDYFALPGIATFRGNNYRNTATYGTAEITNETLTTVWSHRIGMYNGWGGCAWTGQPLVVQWDEETKQLMNLHSGKKNKEGLVEVIYATLDGNIHFYDLADGTETRSPIFMQMNFKGAGALDPRGYPLMYVGSGVNNGGMGARMFIVSLIDGTILWEYGNKDSYAMRNWTAFDSSPLVDAETDTLIWPGENGILYTMKLNTVYDKENGTISVTPDNMVKTTYTTTFSENENRYLGYEPSASIVDHYLYISENGGMFYCVDLNTMELVWAQDTKDDSNSSPAFEWGEDGVGYLYTAPSLHWTAEKSAGTISIYKLNAQTGEIVWEYPIDCVTVKDVSGGVQASPVLGKEGTNIEDLVIYAVARTPKTYDGILIAFDRESGEVVWEVDTKNYSWSSPVAIYTDDGRAYILTCNASGKIRLVDGATGEIVYSLGLEQTCEASPIVFNNMIVLGTREGIYGFKIS